MRRRPVHAIMGKFFARNPKNFVAPTASVMDAITQMRDPPRSFAMVAEGNARVLGLCTERALVRWVLRAHEREGVCLHDAGSVADAMHAHDHLAVAVRPTDDVGRCLRLMHANLFRHLPVFDGDAK